MAEINLSNLLLFQTHQIHLGALFGLHSPWYGHPSSVRLESETPSSLVISEGRSFGKQDPHPQGKPIPGDTQYFPGHPCHFGVVFTALLEGCHDGDAFPLWSMHFHNPCVPK